MEALFGAIVILLCVVALFLFVVLIVQPAVELVTIVAFYALPVLLLGAGIYYNSVALCLLGILSAGFVWMIWAEGRGSRKKRQ